MNKFNPSPNSLFIPNAQILTFNSLFKIIYLIWFRIEFGLGHIVGKWRGRYVSLKRLSIIINDGFAYYLFVHFPCVCMSVCMCKYTHTHICIQVVTKKVLCLSFQVVLSYLNWKMILIYFLYMHIGRLLIMKWNARLHWIVTQFTFHYIVCKM